MKLKLKLENFILVVLGTVLFILSFIVQTFPRPKNILSKNPQKYEGDQNEIASGSESKDRIPGNPNCSRCGTIKNNYKV